MLRFRWLELSEERYLSACIEETPEMTSRALRQSVNPLCDLSQFCPASVDSLIQPSLRSAGIAAGGHCHSYIFPVCGSMATYSDSFNISSALRGLSFSR